MTMSQTTTNRFSTEEWQGKRDQYVARGVSNGNRHLAAKGKEPSCSILMGNDLSILQEPLAH